MEEVNGIQTNKARAKHSQSVMRRPVVAMHHVLQSGVISDKHRYINVEADVAVKQNTVKAPSDMFEPRPSDRSMPFDELVSSKATVDHYSPRLSRIAATLLITR